LIYHEAVSSTTDNGARLFGALADPNRFGILWQLRSGERRVGELCQEVKLAQSLISFHIKALREAGLLRSRRDGRSTWYSIDPAGIARLRELVEGLRDGDHDAGAAARDADLELCRKYINAR
jgi:DNA-binding transcriptional ArsR family regulator